MTKEKYNAYMRSYYHRKKSDTDYLSRKRESARKSQLKRKQAVEAYKKEWRRKNKTKISAYMRKRRNENINAKIADNLRCRLKMALKNNTKTGSAIALLGCSIPEFKSYLETKFQPGMTWENYGQWHIDHKFPLSKADLNSPEELARVCHYSNLQPLWASDNIKKWNKV